MRLPPRALAHSLAPTTYAPRPPPSLAYASLWPPSVPQTLQSPGCIGAPLRPPHTKSLAHCGDLRAPLVFLRAFRCLAPAVPLPLTSTPLCSIASRSPADPPALAPPCAPPLL